MVPKYYSSIGWYGVLIFVVIIIGFVSWVRSWRRPPETEDEGEEETAKGNLWVVNISCLQGEVVTLSNQAQLPEALRQHFPQISAEIAEGLYVEVVHWQLRNTVAEGYLFSTKPSRAVLETRILLTPENQPWIACDDAFVVGRILPGGEDNRRLYHFETDARRGVFGRPETQPAGGIFFVVRFASQPFVFQECECQCILLVPEEECSAELPIVVVAESALSV